MDQITIYTDGSSRGNPGPGGWAAIIIKNNDGGESKVKSQKFQVVEIGGREDKTTNNRMEMSAVINALKNTPTDAMIEIHSDSEYMIKGITEWVYNWQKNGWRTRDKKDVLNQDLWQEMLTEVEKRNVEWMKVAGHSGHKYNDRCDVLATSMADNKNIKLFQGSRKEYEEFLK